MQESVLPVKIVVDENMPFGREAFGRLGEVVTMPGRKITRAELAREDALAIRSVTKVNAQLLEGTPVSFVGTATIGVDHVDTEYLKSRGIAFASAPGSNANSVAEYIMTALLVLARRKGFRLEGKTLGVVGVGNVGSRVVRKAEALGLTVVQNDPPLARQTNEPRFVPIDDLLERVDILTFHVPLTQSGDDATFHLVDDELIGRMRPGVILINTSRGAVADGGAILRGAAAGRFGGLVLDVFEHEPAIDPGLVQAADIATPHIAGYSYDGKVNGTAMIYEAACAHFGRPVEWDAAAAMPPSPHPHLTPSPGADEDVLRTVALTVYNIEYDDAAMRVLPLLSATGIGSHFDHLRKTYPKRREFHNTTVNTSACSSALRYKIEGLGFRVHNDKP